MQLSEALVGAKLSHVFALLFSVPLLPSFRTLCAGFVPAGSLAQGIMHWALRGPHV